MSLEQARQATGWELAVSDELARTEPPKPEELEVSEETERHARVQAPHEPTAFEGAGQAWHHGRPGRPHSAAAGWGWTRPTTTPITARRSCGRPKRPLLPMPDGETERRGPLFGESSVTPTDNDLTLSPGGRARRRAHRRDRPGD